jgi:hypothetical protein
MPARRVASNSRLFRTRGRRRRRHSALGLTARLLLIVSSGAVGVWIALTWILAPPRNVHDACDIFTQYEHWYEDAKRASDRWEVPIPVLLAIIRSESGFRADARPARRWMLWIIPGPRISSATGYSQALDSTWHRYIRATRRHNADRTRFADAIDFVGWYVHQSWQANGIAKHDAYHNYLAYYFGHTGYARGDSERRPGIVKVAVHTQHLADTYRSQLALCQAALEDRVPWWWRPFRTIAWREN